MYLDIAPGNSLGLNVPMPSGDSAGYSDQHTYPFTPMAEHLQISTWFSMGTQTTDISLTFGGNSGHRQWHRPQLQHDHESRHGFLWQRPPAKASSYLPILLLLRIQSHLSPQCTNPLALLSLLSLHHKLHLPISPSHTHPW